MPALQLTQTEFHVYEPMPHCAEHAVEDVLPETEVYVPALQFTHCKDAESPTVDDQVPITHPTHCDDAANPDVDDHVPTPQFKH